MKIDNATRIQIRDAIAHGYRNVADLRMMVSDVLDVRLQDLSALTQPVPQIIFELVDWAEAQGRLLALLLGAHERNPGNPRLREVTASLRITKPVASDVTGDVERIVLKDVAFQHIGPWLDKLTRHRRTVCRVEPQPPTEGLLNYGSGFLVLSDVVMTNHHVVAPFLKSGADRVRLRFDHEVGLDGVTLSGGRTCALAQNWTLLLSPTGEYDFALIRLAEPAGKDAVAGTTRGWLKLTAHEFTPAEPVLIVQHPAARPLSLALGSVLQPEFGTDRVTYNVNTEPGSSGSPCLTAALDAVAIHHYGADDQNRGVRFDAIRRFLQSRQADLKAMKMEELLA